MEEIQRKAQRLRLAWVHRLPVSNSVEQAEAVCAHKVCCRVGPDGCDKCALKQPFLMWRSALKDHRFPPMQPEEMKYLHCGVSLLVNYEEGKAWNDFEVGFGHCPLCYASALTYGGAMQIGKHGIIIEFGFTNGDHYNATYLPEVAKEQGTAGTVGHCLLHP